jgi:hypothetical protein
MILPDVRFYMLGAFLLCSVVTAAQPKNDAFLRHILEQNQDQLFRQVLSHKDEFRLQIIYTQVNRDKNNHPSFHNYYFNTDTNLYFNPASTVKLPLALLALEKLNTINVRGADKYSFLLFDSSYEKQSSMATDSTARDLKPSIAHFIKKAFLVSDNDAYNRLYQFVGQQSINRKLREKGYASARITRQFLGLSEEGNRHTNRVRLLSSDGHLVYDQPPAYNQDSFYYGKPVRIGKGYLDNRDSLVNEPIDFTRANNLPLEDLQQILQSALFPSSVPQRQRFKLRDQDYPFIYQYLSQYPSETNYPKYDSAEYYDSYVKFYFRNGGHQLPPYVRVFNKVGWAYGFLIDVSYVVDFMHRVEFMLSSTLYVNSDGILNDDKYDYESTGWPFLYQLGQTIYQFELKRPRKFTPDLRRFKIAYERRIEDGRATVRNVDN